MIEKRFGRLTVKEYAFSKCQQRYWKCICDCGKEHLVKTKYLNNGDTKSCGCLAKEISSINAEGMYKKSSACKRNEVFYLEGRKHPLYNVWKGIKRRCYSESCREYRWYGARNITLCEEWINNPTSFIQWGMSHGYDTGLQIDRIDRDKGYHPSNCEFVSRSENLRRMHERKNGSSSKREENPKV